ncbi:hypothetical protein D3C75_701640 [compost metagenome]
MPSGGQLRALARFEIPAVIPFGRPRLTDQLIRLLKQPQADTEGSIAALGTGQTLKDQIRGSTLADRPHLGGNMGQNAVLRRDVPPCDYLHRFVEEAHNIIRCINDRIDADYRVSHPVAERFIN